MKYVSDDGELFADERACREHEKVVAHHAALGKEVDKWLGMKEYASERARSRDRTIIMRWIHYDVRQNPGRYAVTYTEPEK